MYIGRLCRHVRSRTDIYVSRIGRIGRICIVWDVGCRMWA